MSSLEAVASETTACTRPLASFTRIHVAAMLPAAIFSQAVTSADMKSSQKNRILKPALAAPGIRFQSHPISAGEGKGFSIASY